MTGEKEFQEALLGRLDLLIGLMLDCPLPEVSVQMTDKIRRLHELGVKRVVISRLVGKPSNYVGATIDRLEKAKTKKKGGSKNA